MPSSSGYTSHFSADAVAAVLALPKRKQTKVMDIVETIAEHPFRIGDYPSTDADGHELQNLLVDEFHFTYWVDHAVKEVRITELIQV